MSVSAGNCSLPKAWWHWRFPSGETKWSVSNHSSTKATISRIRKSYIRASDQSGKIIALTVTRARQLSIPLRDVRLWSLLSRSQVSFPRTFWCHVTTLKVVILCSKEGYRITQIDSSWTMNALTMWRLTPSDTADQFNYEVHLTLDGEIALGNLDQNSVDKLTVCLWLQLLAPDYFQMLYQAADDNGTIDVTLTFGQEITLGMFGQTRYDHSI